MTESGQIQPNSEIPQNNEMPKPPDVITAAENWNSLSHEARTFMMSQAVGVGFISPNTAQTKIEIDMAAHENFWDDNERFMAEMPSMRQTIADARANSQDYSRILRARPLDVIGSRFDYRGQHSTNVKSTIQMTESEALEDTARFISEIKKVALDNNDEDLLSEVDGLENRTGYMSEKVFDMAVGQLALAWVDYVSKSPDNVLNIFEKTQRGLDGNIQKSHNFVLDRIKQALAAIDISDEVRDRLIFDSDNWRDTTGAKLVTVDDWTMSGFSIGAQNALAVEEAMSRGLGGLSDNAEVHLLAALGRSLRDNENYDVRAIFKSNLSDNVHGNTMTGWHSSVDYGFEVPVKEMIRAASELGEQVKPPFLHRLDRHFRPDVAPDELAKADWSKIEQLNNRELAIDKTHRRILEIRKNKGRQLSDNLYSSTVDTLTSLGRQAARIQTERKDIRRSIHT